MTLTSTQLEQIRLSLLRYIATSGIYGMHAQLLLISIRNEGFRGLTKEQLEAEIQYLVDKELIAPREKTLSPENKAWRVTAKGRDFLAELNIDIPTA